MKHTETSRLAPSPHRPVAPSPLVDTHAHLMDPAFQEDLPQVLQRAWEHGLRAIVCVGYDLASSRQAVELAETDSRIFAAVGVHPNYASQAGPDDLDQIEGLAAGDRVVAIGETGLDNFRQLCPPDLQRAFLARHLEIAARLGLPVVVHNREAAAELTEALVQWADAGAADRKGVLHCFSGDHAMLERCAAAGFYVSFAGTLTFKNAGWLPEAAREVPLTHALVETDCPYLAPSPLRGRRNEPSFVVHTARRLAEVRGDSYAQVASATTRNALALFGIEGAEE